MSCGCDDDDLPILSGIPGPRGAAGTAGSGGASGSSGKNAYAVTTAPFTMPAANATAVVAVDHTDWCAVGQSLFVESAGYFLVGAIPSAVSLSLTAQDVPSNATAGTIIPTGKRVVAGGLPHIDGTALDDLDERVVALENSPGGNQTIYANSPPTGSGLRVGDIWFDTAHDRKPYRWDGSGWIDVSDARTSGLVSDVADLHTGVNTISTAADALKQEYVLAVVGSGASKRIAGFRVTVPGGGEGPTEFVVQADKFAILGPDGTGKDSPFYVEDGVVYMKDAVVRYVQAGKITAGDLQAVNFGFAGRLFHTADTNVPKHYFRSVDFGTSFAASKAFGSDGSGFGFSHCTPVTAYGPLAPGWTSSVTTACPDNLGPGPTGSVRVQIQGRLIGYTGNILVYCQIGSGPYAVLAARSSSDSGNAVIDTTRILTGVLPTDTVKIFVAPADGNGVVTPGVTCRYEIDATFFNW